MSADGGHLGWRVGSSDKILKENNLRTIPAKFGYKWLCLILKIFPIRSYIKKMSADGNNNGCQVESWDMILKRDPLRIIPSKFDPNWPCSFRRRVFSIFPIRSLKLCRLMSAVLVFEFISERGPDKNHSN